MTTIRSPFSGTGELCGKHKFPFNSGFVLVCFFLMFVPKNTHSLQTERQLKYLAPGCLSMYHTS